MSFVQPSEETIKRSFAAFDKDSNGNISASEMQIILNKCGYKVSQLHCTDLIKHFDKNSSGVMEFPEFQQLVAEAVKMKQKELLEEEKSP